MHISIENYRGLVSVDIDLAPTVTLIAGANATGKTSFCQALAAAATGQPLPFEKMPKNAASQLVSDRHENGIAAPDEASVVLSVDASSTAIQWPKCRVVSKGTPPQSSLTAVGRQRLTAMEARERAAYAASVFGAMPTKDALTAELGLDTDPVWKLVTVSGWDGAYEDFRQRLTKCKGRWEQITGENYGSNKAASWSPPGLPTSDEATLVASIAALHKILNQSIAHRALDDAERTRLQALAGNVDQLNQAELTTTNSLTSEKAKRAALPPDPERELARCPHCQQDVLVKSRTELLKPPAQMSHDELRTLRLERAALDGRISKLQGDLYDTQRQRDEAIKARERLAADTGAAQQPDTDDTAIRRQIEAEEGSLAALRAYNQAQAVVVEMDRFQKIIDVLSPTGLRQRTLAAALGQLNTRLASVCGVAGWKLVTLSNELRVSYGGRLYELCSESEQFRCDVTLQLTIVRWYENSGMIVIDRADLLDSPGRTGLIKALGRMKCPAVVGMMIQKREMAPSLGAKGLGVTYWLGADGAAEVV